MAVSGGLDSCTITRWLVAEGVNVVALTADLGQRDEADVNDMACADRTNGGVVGEAVVWGFFVSHCQRSEI